MAGWIPTFHTSRIFHHNSKPSPIFKWKPTLAGSSEAQQRKPGMQSQALCTLTPAWLLRALWPRESYLPSLSPSSLTCKSGRWIPSLQGCRKDWKKIYARVPGRAMLVPWKLGKLLKLCPCLVLSLYALSPLLWQRKKGRNRSPIWGYLRGFRYRLPFGDVC